jgi:hypothetical protein
MATDSDAAQASLTHRDLRVLAQALNEVLNGPEAIEDWEFHTRMGVKRDEAKLLLNKVRQSLD